MAASSGGCHDGAGPDDVAGEAVLVVGGEGARLALVEGATGRVVSRPGPFARDKGPSAIAADGATVYFSALPDDAPRTLYSLDARTGRTRWSLAVYDPRDRRRVDGYALFATALATTPASTGLVMGEAYAGADDATFGQPGNETGVALLDAVTRRVVRFVRPLRVVEDGGLATLPPGPAADAGAVLAIGSRAARGTSPSLDWLFILDATTLAVQDSATVTAPAGDAGGTLRQVVAAPDGRSVYLVGRAGGAITKYDLVTRSVVATAALPSAGRLTVAPDGGTLYLTDPGVERVSPGSGMLYVFGPDLEPRTAIDLRGASVQGVPPVTRAVAVSRDLTRLYVAVGTASLGGSTFPTQQQRLLVVDAATGAILRDVALGDYGTSVPYVP